MRSSHPCLNNLKSSFPSTMILFNVYLYFNITNFFFSLMCFLILCSPAPTPTPPWVFAFLYFFFFCSSCFVWNYFSQCEQTELRNTWKNHPLESKPKDTVVPSLYVYWRKDSVTSTEDIVYVHRQKPQDPSQPILHLQKILLSYYSYEMVMKQKTFPILILGTYALLLLLKQLTL